ncbi:MAG: molybdopterin molybdotransferase MoeA [Phototrophicales bacterium]
MSEFFVVKTVEDALDLLKSEIQISKQIEHISTYNALDRVIARAPLSPSDLPTFVRSTMDGYAVRAADTFGASQSLPAYLTVKHTIHIGTTPNFTLLAGEAAETHTGAMLPPGADAVVMVERTQKISDCEIEVLSPVAPGENLVQIGEDIQQGQPILPVGHRVRPQDIGGLLAVGITHIDVMMPPKVAILSSGNELVPPDKTPAVAQIRDINAYILSAMFQQIGAKTHVLGIAHDTIESLETMAKSGLDQADMLVMSAGSSVSAHDLTRQVINNLGKPGVLQHGLAVKPGKPTIIACCDGKPVIGLPGNPVSAVLVARWIVLPIIHYLLGERARPIGTIRATLKQNIASTTGRLDAVPVKLIQNEQQVFAEPVLGKSNLIYRLVNADGIITVGLNQSGLKTGEQVEVVLI